MFSSAKVRSVAGAFAGLLVAGSCTPCLADTYPRQPGLDALNYAFRLTLSDETDEIAGEATVGLGFRDAGLQQITLDLVKADAAGRGMTVESVTDSVQPLGFRQEAAQLLISLPRPSAAGERRSLVVRYRGTPAAGLLIAKNKHGDRTFFSDNWPNKARNWLPVIDHPYDKATCEFLVSAPAHYQVVSNGLRIEETDQPGGTRLTHWKQSIPIASWLYVLGVAPFAVQRLGDFGGRPVETWVFAPDRDQGFLDFAWPTLDALAFFDRTIGPYPYEKLANVQANGISGGMETASAILYSPDSVTGTRSERWRNVIVHEIAHQWWGNSVTEADWDDVWLSEGFATYFTLLFTEHAHGRDAFTAGLRKSRDSVRAFEETNPGYRVVHDTLTDMRRVISGQTYQKGAWTLHMLRGLLGTEAFWKGIRAHYAAHANGNATTADFQRAMEEACGRPLGWFFDQWLRRGGFPRVEGSWRFDEAAKQVELDLRQVQPGAPFRLPMEVAVQLDEAKPPALERIELAGTRTVLRLPAGSEPTRVSLDPGLWVLMDATLTRQEGSAAQPTALIPGHPTVPVP